MKYQRVLGDRKVTHRVRRPTGPMKAHNEFEASSTEEQVRAFWKKKKKKRRESVGRLLSL